MAYYLPDTDALKVLEDQKAKEMEGYIQPSDPEQVRLRVLGACVALSV